MALTSLTFKTIVSSILTVHGQLFDYNHTLVKEYLSDGINSTCNVQIVLPPSPRAALGQRKKCVIKKGGTLEKSD